MEFVLFIYVFFWVLVCPCQLFVRLWYRVSDVLDLSLMSKRFGFPYYTCYSVNFQRNKAYVGLSDCRTIGPSDCRTIGLSDYRSDPISTILEYLKLYLLFFKTTKSFKHSGDSLCTILKHYNAIVRSILLICRDGTFSICKNSSYVLL